MPVETDNDAGALGITLLGAQGDQGSPSAGIDSTLLSEIGFGGVLDQTPPTVGNFSPANGTTITDTDPIFFDVTDNSGEFRRVIVAVTQGDQTELAHDGDAFLAPYSDLSTRINIADGFRYTLRRSGGWSASATVRVFAVDLSGNEA